MFEPVLLAHQGGWDEILFVLSPLLVFAGLLAVAKRRVKRLEEAQKQERSTVDDAESADRT